MIVALKPGVTQESREQLMDWLQNLGLHIHVSEGEYQTILGLVGDTTKVDMDLVASLDIVDSVKREDRRRKLLRHGGSLLRGI